MSGKVIHLAAARAAREQMALLRSLARGVMHIPVDPPPAQVLTVTPEQIDQWLTDERIDPSEFWSGVPRGPLAIGDVADAINAIVRGRSAYRGPFDGKPSP